MTRHVGDAWLPVERWRRSGASSGLQENHLEEADRLARFITEMRKMVVTAPPTRTPETADSDG
jgi:hypothetical protein